MTQRTDSPGWGRDVGPSAEEREPPKLMAELRRSIDALCAGREDDVVVEHYFDAEGAFGLPSESGGATYGWGTSLTPTAQGWPLWIWFDGFDQDLALMLRETYWFEWLDLEDEQAVIQDALGLCAGVLSGDVWEWGTRRRRGVDVLTPAGRLLSVTDGRLRGLPWGEDRELRFRRRLPAYRRDEGTGPASS